MFLYVFFVEEHIHTNRYESSLQLTENCKKRKHSRVTLEARVLCEYQGKLENVKRECICVCVTLGES